MDIGDIVDIFWENVQAEFEVKILHKPCATGDSWVLERTDGTEILVNSFSKMIKFIPVDESEFINK